MLAPVAGAVPADVKFAANGLAPRGSVVAFKLVDEGGKLDAAAGLAVARPGLAARADRRQRDGVRRVERRVSRRGTAAAPASTAAQRAQRSLPAVLYALDGATGKELWSSGKTITSFARAGLSAGGGQVYLVTYDNHAVRVRHPDGTLRSCEMNRASIGLIAAALAGERGNRARRSCLRGRGRTSRSKVCGTCHPAERGASVRLTPRGLAGRHRARWCRSAPRAPTKSSSGARVPVDALQGRRAQAAQPESRDRASISRASSACCARKRRRGSRPRQDAVQDASTI